MNSLHEYFPATPTFPVVQDLGQYFRTPPWNQIGMFVLWVHFSVIGFTFLLPTDLSFSLWFFYFFYKAEGILAAAYGHQITYVPNYPVPTYAAMQMLGAFFALFAGMMYAARLHLRDVWRNTAALWRRDIALTDDSTEPLSYRTAVLGGAAAICCSRRSSRWRASTFCSGCWRSRSSWSPPWCSRASWPRAACSSSRRPSAPAT